MTTTVLNSRLMTQAYLSGFSPSAEDAKAFADLFGANANVAQWAARMASYYQAEREQLAGASAAPEESAKPAKAAADDDDVDLFGEETEEEKAALAAKKAKDEEAKKAKKVVIAKSSILVDIKPWDDTTDMAEYATKLHAIEMDGLLWGDFKMVPVAFGLKKLQQLLVIEDDKISGDDLEELLTAGWAEEYVQSIDIVAWNKV